MSGDSDDYSTSGIHPAEVYATEDIQMVVIKRGPRITGRCLVNKAKREYTCIYGDSETMTPLLKECGLTRGDLTGCRLLNISCDYGQVMPYLDGNADIYSHSSEYVTVGYVSNGDYIGSALETGGCLTEQRQCHDCGGGMHEEEEFYIECNDTIVCEACASENYFYDEHSETMLPTEEGVEIVGHEYDGLVSYQNPDIIEHDGQWYYMDELAEFDIYEVDCEYYHIDELVTCEYLEEFVHNSEATYIPSIEGYVHDDYVVILEGVPFLKDSDELQEAIDDSRENFQLVGATA